MGRHFCKLCCESHPLPTISQRKGGDQVDTHGVPCSQFAMQETRPEVLSRTGFKRIEGVRMADSDFSETHTISTLTLRIPKQGLLEGGFWSWVFSAEIVGHGWGSRGNAKVGSQGRPLTGRVLVKVYKEQSVLDRKQVFDTFHRELTALGTLGELPGVVTCSGFGFTQDSWPFLILQHVGVPLSAVLESARDKVVEKHLAAQLLGTLESVHTMGLAHNDLHADNIMLQEGQEGRLNVVLVDWNSCVDCVLVAGEGPGDFGIIEDEGSKPTAETAETVGVIRDCQAAGKVMLLCLDPHTHEKTFGGMFMGTLDDWAAAAGAISSSSNIESPWKEALPPLVCPRKLDPVVNGCVTYPIVSSARQIAGHFNKGLSKSKWGKTVN